MKKLLSFLASACVALTLLGAAAEMAWAQSSTQSAALGATQNLPDLGDASQAILSPQQERELGADAMKQIRADPAYSDDSEVVDYLNMLISRLAAAGPDTHQQFSAFLVMDPEINAFAMPGGYVGVNAGLLLAAQSESEVAGVLGHEISHVLQHHIARQIAQQQRASILAIAGLLAGLVAASRSGGSNVGEAAIVGTQAALVQSQLSYSRGYEQEADRMGFQIMTRAGFDPQAMATFFERLQQQTRIYDTAPVYLQTHPLTSDRIADMENRAQNAPYRQVPDSLEFQLVRAKVRIMMSPVKDSVRFFQDSLRDKRYLSEAAARYGLATSLMLNKNYPEAKAELERLRKLVPSHPMIEALAGQLYNESGDTETAMKIYQNGLQAYPGNRTLTYDYADMLLRHNQPGDALKLVENQLNYTPTDSHLYELQARAYAAFGKLMAQHLALANAYFYQDDLDGAINQLQIAQRDPDGDEYQRASVEARLKELRALQPDDDDGKKKKKGG